MEGNLLATVSALFNLKAFWRRTAAEAEVEDRR